MNDEPVSAQAEGEALPASIQPPPKGGFFSSAEKAVEAALHPAIEAVERWYAAHFHAHAVAGTAPLSADDKAALIQHVADAVAPPATQE